MINKRIFSMVLILAMIFTMIPVGPSFAGPVGDFAVDTIGDQQVSFTFSAPTGATSVKISQTDDGSNWIDATTGALDENSTSATVTGLTNGVLYGFRLSATDADGSWSSNSKSATPVGTVNLTLTDDNGGTVDIGDTITVTVTESSKNEDSGIENDVSIVVENNAGETINVIAFETGDDTGIFESTFTLAKATDVPNYEIKVVSDDTITATYDYDIGTVTDTLTVATDGESPVINVFAQTIYVGELYTLDLTTVSTDNFDLSENLTYSVTGDNGNADAFMDEDKITMKYTPVDGDIGPPNVAVFVTAQDAAGNSSVATNVFLNVKKEVSFSNLSANGTPGDVTTTELNIALFSDVGLAVEDITLTGATKGTLTYIGAGQHILVISDITVLDGQDVTVELNKTGYIFAGNPKTEAVNVKTLGGTVTIDGTPKYNEVLTANISSLTNNADTGTLEYQWQRDGTNISGATSFTYTTVESDIGSTLTVDVISLAEPGNVTSSPTSSIEKQDGPTAPKVVNAGSTYDDEILLVGGEEKVTVTIGANMTGDYEYSPNTDSAWYDLPIDEITGLSSSVTQIYIREKATNTVKVGMPGFTSVFITDALTVDSIAITKQPTLTYTQGDSLDLSGMEVTETYNDGSENVLEFIVGTATGYTADPWNGSMLLTSDNDGNPVTITHTDTGKTANTANLTVTPAVTKVMVKITTPDKTTYTEGETLDLTGLVVTLTKSDSTNVDVNLEDFVANDLTVSPTEGTPLATADVNVVVTHGASGLNADYVITVTVDKTTLDTAITNAQDNQNGTEESNSGQASVFTLKQFTTTEHHNNYLNAIRDAQDISDDSGATQGEIDQAVIDLSIATTTFNNSKLFGTSKVTPTQDTTVSATAIDEGDTLTESTLTGTFKDFNGDTVVGNLDWDDTITAHNSTGNHSWKFTPADDMTYNSTTGSVEVVVNAGATPPSAVDSSFSIAEGSIHNGAVSGVGDTLTYILQTGPQYGTLTFNTDGSFTYSAHRQPTLGFINSDTFTFSATDGNQESNIATVSIAITSVNDVPVATSQSITTDIGVEANGNVSATDIDGDALTYSVVTGPEHGTLIFSADGSYTYTATDNNQTSDSFVFKANDGVTSSNNATVTITITDVPVTVTQVRIKTEPTKTRYTEGEALDLTGLVITLNKSDGFSEDINFVDFSANDLTVNPTNGASLITTDTSVIIIHGNTNRMDSFLIEVNEDKTVVDALELDSLVTAPVTGETPDSSVIDETQYTGTVTWYETADSTLVVGDFETETHYTAEVELTAKSGYTFEGVGVNSFSYTDASVYNSENSGTVAINFPATEKEMVLANGDLYFYLDNGDGTATITGFEDTDGDTIVTIPNTIEGLTVTTIGSSAFDEETLTAVNFNDDLETIQANAFNSNAPIDEIRIPLNVNVATNMGSNGGFTNAYLSAGNLGGLYKYIDSSKWEYFYKVEFKDYDGTILKTEFVERGLGPTAPSNPTRSGYTFIGWARDSWDITSVVTITAEYTIIPATTYTVEFKDHDGTILKTETVEEGSGATAPANLTRSGYTFDGWDQGFDNVTSDLMVTAEYTIIPATTYTVEFKDHDGTILKTETVEEGSGAIAPANPTRSGYTFDGWDQSFENVTSNLIVTAEYTIIPATTYTVEFNDHDGTILKTETVEEGSGATAPANPTRSGYTFDGWDQAFDNVTSNLIVTAEYTIIPATTYTVEFKDHDGTSLKTETVEEGSGAIAPANPTRSGYTFDGWDQAFDNVTSNLIVTAKYRRRTSSSNNNNNNDDDEDDENEPVTTVKTSDNVSSTVSYEEDTTMIELKDLDIPESEESDSNNENTTDEEKNDVEIVVDNDLAKVDVKLPKETLKNLEKVSGSNLKITTKNSTYEVPVDELSNKSLAKKLNVSEDTLADDDVSVNINISEDKETGAMEYTIKVTTKNGVFEITEFNSYVARILNSDHKVVAGVRLYDEIEGLDSVPTYIYQEDGKWYGRINSLTNSKYKLVFEDNKILEDSVENHWAKEIVLNMATRKIIPEDLQLNFKPDKEITREDYVVLVTRALGIYIRDKEISTDFTDVSSTNDQVAINNAVYYELINGYPDNTFKPNQTITREESMAIFSRALELVELDDKYVNRHLQYKDYDDISNWALENVKKSVNTGIFNGNTLGELKPKDNISYAETLQVLRNLLTESELINKD